MCVRFRVAGGRREGGVTYSVCNVRFTGVAEGVYRRKEREGEGWLNVRVEESGVEEDYK